MRTLAPTRAGGRARPRAGAGAVPPDEAAVTADEALRSLPPLQAAAVRMAFGLALDRPYKHTDEEIARRLEVTPVKARMLREAGLHALRLKHVPSFL